MPMYLSALLLECLPDFDARAVILFGLEEDLTIKLLGSFGVGPREIDQLGTLHFLRESHFSRCLSANTVEQVPSQQVEVAVVESNHVVFLPVAMRGAPYAGVAIWTVEDPAVQEQEHFWEAVSLAVGLSLTCHWIPRSGNSTADDSRSVDLTSRQLDILTLVAQGLTNREIARRLNYGLSTIGHELMAIFRVLGVDSREAAGREGGRRGLLSSSVQRSPLEYQLTF